MRKIFITLTLVCVSALVISQVLNAKDKSASLAAAETSFALPGCVPGDHPAVAAPAAKERLRKLKEEVEWLREERKDDSLVYQRLLQELQRDYCGEVSQYTLGQLARQLEELSARCALPGHFLRHFTMPTKGSRATKNQQACQQDFQLLGNDEIQAITEQFDLLRDALSSYLRLLDNQYLCDLDRKKANLAAVLDCKVKALELKKELIRARGAFISERVITPYLCETEKLLFLARGKWWTLGKADYKKLCQSVLLLSHAFHTKWLYESTEETRFHFVRVWKQLKRKSKKREWEEFIVLSTMADSFDPSKHRGPVAWWNDCQEQ